MAEPLVLLNMTINTIEPTPIFPMWNMTQFVKYCEEYYSPIRDWSYILIIITLITLCVAIYFYFKAKNKMGAKQNEGTNKN